MTTTASAQAEQTPQEGLHGQGFAVSLTAKDVKKSVHWYRDIVGFGVEQEHEHEGEVVAYALKAGNVRVFLNQDDGAKGWDRVKGEGFSLYIDTTQDVDEIAAGIKARGGTLHAEPTDMPWGARVLSLVDPDGYRWGIGKTLGDAS